MVRGIVESVLGPVGVRILHFYEANSLSINLIVLAYGFVMLASWTTLIRIYQYMVVSVARQIHLHPNLNRKSSIKKIRETITIPWQEAVNAAPFPLIASQIALLPVPKSARAIQKVVDEQELVSHALEVLKGANPRKVRPSYRKMWGRMGTKKDTKKDA